MTRRKLIAGNWKMNGLRSDLGAFDAIAGTACQFTAIDVAICPPATLIALACMRAPDLVIGAQDCHAEDSGAHTGNLSAQMLGDAGAKLVIVGHSERRTEQGETDADVQAKALAAHRHGLTAIVCVGETEAERDAGNAEARVSAQLDGSVPRTGEARWLVIAYEPVWAIGTGRIPTLEDVAVMHETIRAKLAELLGEEAEGVRILYGGSMNGGNAEELLAIPNVDGGLVGGASLSAEKFVPIIKAAAALA